MLARAVRVFLSATAILLSFSPLAQSQMPVKMNAPTKAWSGIHGDSYKISYTYDFKKTDNVYVKGFGLVPPKGTFSYVTDDPTLTVHDAGFEKVLYRATPEVMRVDYQIEIADESAFSAAGREERWTSELSFVPIATSVLNALGFLYSPYERRPLYFVRSSYVALKDLPRNVRGEVAVLLSQPHSPRDKGSSFRVQMALRERRVKEERWTTQVAEETAQKASSLMNEVIRKLLEQGAPKK